MVDSNTKVRPHSDEYFGDERDFWWNEDFLDLMARRLGLKTVKRIADIGCGIGHWSALMFARIGADAELVGIDRDPANVSQARERMARRFPTGRIAFQQGDAMALPFPDHSFDAVTCQTLLIHLPDVAGALAEMIRITRPGGIVFVSEPNNTIGNFGASSLTMETSPEMLARNAECAWRYAIGRAKRSLGCEFIGDLLPGIFSKAGLRDIGVWVSDKASPFTPPYQQPDQLATLAAVRRWQEEGSGPFDEATLRANILAGGGTEALVQAALDDMKKNVAAMLDGIRVNNFHAAGGGLHYIVAGRLPS